MAMPFAYWQSAAAPSGPIDQVFNTQNLSISYTVPSGYTTCVAELWGCGGNGGEGDSGQGAGGGGGGGYCKKTFAVTGGTVITGQNGAGGSIYPTQLNVSSLSIAMTAFGGSWGFDATSGGGGGGGGAATGGDVNHTGTAGTAGNNSGYGGAGGNAAGPLGSSDGGTGGAGNTAGGFAAGVGTNPGGGGGGGADAANSSGGAGGAGRWKIHLT